MLEEKLTRIKKLMEQRDKINAELADLVGMSAPSKRGRPRKEHGDGSSTETPICHSVSVGWSSGQSTAQSQDGE